jgi:alpha-tubulin suppressor-like RCC1 family protein
MTLEQIKKLNAIVWAFGSNEMAELGIGHYNEASMPERARGLPKFKVACLSSGGKHTGIVTVDGKLWMCGSRKFE